MLRLLDLAAAHGTYHHTNQRIMKDNYNYLVEGQDALPAEQRNNLPAGTTARAEEWAEVPVGMQSAQTGGRTRNKSAGSHQKYFGSNCSGARRYRSIPDGSLY